MSQLASSSPKLTVALAGAGGYIGSWFIEQYKDAYHLIGLSRGKAVSNPYPEVDWRQVELYSITSTAEALRGVDVAIYLVHSMSASTRLNQGSFEDTDLILADLVVVFFEPTDEFSRIACSQHGDLVAGDLFALQNRNARRGGRVQAGRQHRST